MPIAKETLQRLTAELSGITLTESQAEALAPIQEAAMKGLARFSDAPLFTVEPAVRVRPVQARATAGTGKEEAR